jgi:hypothetical protein
MKRRLEMRDFVALSCRNRSLQGTVMDKFGEKLLKFWTFGNGEEENLLMDADIAWSVWNVFSHLVTLKQNKKTKKGG